MDDNELYAQALHDDRMAERRELTSLRAENAKLRDDLLTRRLEIAEGRTQCDRHTAENAKLRETLKATIETARRGEELRRARLEEAEKLLVIAGRGVPTDSAIEAAIDAFLAAPSADSPVAGEPDDLAETDVRKQLGLASRMLGELSAKLRELEAQQKADGKLLVHLGQTGALQTDVADLAVKVTALDKAARLHWGDYDDSLKPWPAVPPAPVAEPVPHRFIHGQHKSCELCARPFGALIHAEGKPETAGPGHGESGRPCQVDADGRCEWHDHAKDVGR